jgi:hypothetical protein
MAFTDLDKLKAVTREVAMRRRVYPRFVAEHRMTQEGADREIAIMVEIAEDYGIKVADQQPELELVK